MRQEIDALVSAGCNYIQLDEPGLTITPYGLALNDAADAINTVLKGVSVTPPCMSVSATMQAGLSQIDA